MRLSLMTALLLVSTSLPAQQPIDPKVQSRIDRILKKTPLIDGHNDLPWELRQNHEYRVEGLESGTDRLEKPLMTDMERLRKGRVGAQLWSVYISAATKGDEAIRHTIEQLDAVDRLVKAYPSHLEWARTADDIVRIHKQGRIASMAGVEGGQAIEGSLEHLPEFARRGVRTFGLVHFTVNDLAAPAYGLGARGTF